MLKCIQVIAVRETYQGSLLITLPRFFRFLEGNFFTNSPTESERSDRFQPGKFLKIIEHVSQSIRYCKISLQLIGAVTFQTPGLLLTHPVEKCPLYGGLITFHHVIWDKNICPLFRGVRCTEVSINGGSTLYKQPTLSF